jgi:hypothetical protein
MLHINREGNYKLCDANKMNSVAGWIIVFFGTINENISSMGKFRILVEPY